MAIDAKAATGGGVTLFVLSGSSSYLITNSINEGEIEEQKTSKDVVVSPQTEEENELTPIGQGTTSTSTTHTQSRESSATSRTDTETVQTSESQAGTAQTALINEPSESEEQSPQDSETTSEIELDDDQKAMKEKMTANKFGKIEGEESCLDALKESIDDENYKTAVKACYTNLTFEERAKQLNIALLVTKEKGNKEALTTRFNSLGSGKIYSMATDSTASIDWSSSNTNDANLKVFCESVKKLSLEQTSGGSSQSIEKEWSNFLMVCAQEENLNKDFWTVEATGN